MQVKYYYFLYIFLRHLWMSTGRLKIKKNKHSLIQNCVCCRQDNRFCWSCSCGFQICQACMNENLWGMTCNHITWVCPDCGKILSFWLQGERNVLDSVSSVSKSPTRSIINIFQARSPSTRDFTLTVMNLCRKYTDNTKPLGEASPVNSTLIVFCPDYLNLVVMIEIVCIWL